MHWLLLSHRYLGIAVGVLMAMWCVSGVVMMYVPYPALDESDRLANLAPIEWHDCCRISPEALADTDPVDEFRIEMLAGRPVLQLRAGAKPGRLIDLITGVVIDGVAPDQAASVANTYHTAAHTVPMRPPDLIEYDQWTVAEGFDPDRPLYRFKLGGRQHTELYVSSTTGRAVQITTSGERFWNWIGSVPHWLYFAQLRRRAALWTQIIIVTSLVGCFLAATGLYIGVRQFLRRTSGRLSPYVGFKLWHHLAGLAFGILTLTWVLSGFLSINPWGLLEGGSAQPERGRLRGEAISGAQVIAGVEALSHANSSAYVSVEGAPLDGRLYFIATAANGERWRLDTAAVRAPLSDADLAYIAVTLGGTEQRPVPQLLSGDDSYYFSHHHEVVRLPVYRLILRDASATRYYIDPMSGRLLAKIDQARRGYRWWHEGLHRMDFAAILRGRPQWDALMLLLMSGVTVLCTTGAYLGYRRLLRGGT